MPWIYVDTENPHRARLTDDDANEIGLITGIRVEYRRDALPSFPSPGSPMQIIPGRIEGEAIIEIMVTDLDRFGPAFGYGV